MLNKSNKIISIKIIEKIIIENTVFFSLIIILKPAFNIKYATQHLIPTNAYWTYLFSIKASKNKEMIKIIIKDGNTTPKVAIILPNIFFCL